MENKIILIGLDGAPWSLIQRWINEDKLPTFRQISRKGFKGILKSTVPSITFPAVPSLLTGMNPGNLGVFSFFKADNSPITLWDIDYDKIWSTLSKQGGKSCVVNIPLSYPPQEINGVMVSGWSPSNDSVYTYPENIQEEIVGFHDEDIQENLFTLRNKKNSEEHRKILLNALKELVEKRYRFFMKLYSEAEYDLGILWIYQTDFLQHCCWEFEDLIFQLYLKIDDILRDIISRFPERNIIVLSDHGFESRPTRYFSINSWLKNNNYLKQQGGLINYFAIISQHVAYNYLPKKWVTKIIKIWQSRQNQADKESAIERFDNFPGIDQKNSEAYLSTMFGISLQDTNNDLLKEEIITKLKKIQDEKGYLVVRDACKKEDVYRGKHLDELPDIIFLTSEKYVPFPALSKNLFGKINRKGYWWQTGEHYRERNGIILGCGPDITFKDETIHANIEDIYPTILHMLDCPIPSSIDGIVLKDLCASEKEPVFREKYDREEVTDEESAILDKDDEEKILERLKKLGYI